MMSSLFIVIAFAVLSLLLMISWVLEIGILRGFIAGLCRVGWCLPFVMALYPEQVSQYVPQSLKTNPIYILLDDSDSMGVKEDASSPIAKSTIMIRELTQMCQEFLCDVKVEKLSDFHKETKQGYTPLQDALTQWLPELIGRPWFLLSDGGDWRPQRRWETLAQYRKVALGPGKVIDLSQEEEPNVWLAKVNVPAFAFAEKPFRLSFLAQRRTQDTRTERIQVQVYSRDQLIAARDMSFERALEAQQVMDIQALAKGVHALKVRIVPVANEKVIWDNESHHSLEVMPNTVGILHLLGTPSWDGRFMRRYLKSEPKYDLISFFILRDPADSQSVDERELSLIPFPTNRLFQEELPNFKALVIQNFTLYQFLASKYQKNLVSFVQNGGGALFIGGPRALQHSDISGSPLRDILPFAGEGASLAMRSPLQSFSHDTYNPNLRFKVKLANPSPEQRMLANVFEDWKALGPLLEAMPPLQGMHDTRNFNFKDDSYTPLLEAELENGERIPLAVASYPNKGRAIWVFTDQLWRLALDDSAQSSRQNYSHFLQSAMSWLLRDELRRPLSISHFEMLRASENEVTWHMRLSGPAAKFLDKGGEWSVQVCQKVIAKRDIVYERLASNDWLLKGNMLVKFQPGQQCAAKVKAYHSSFGSIEAQMITTLPYVLSDKDIKGSTLIMRTIAKHTGAEYIAYDDYSQQNLRDWLRTTMGQSMADVRSKLNTSLDHYWFFKQWWVYLLFILIPIEILVRRWHIIAS